MVMTPEELNEFRANPGDLLGTRVLSIFPPTANTVNSMESTLRVGTTDVPARRYYPPNNVHNLYMSHNPDQDRFEVSGNNPGKDRTSQRLNSYFLPWDSNRVYYLHLDNLQNVDFFFTAELNGCCVFASGGQNAPVIVHANLSPAELEDITLDKGSLGAQAAQLRKHQLKVYDKYYGELLGLLFEESIVVSEPPWVAFDPNRYFERGGNKARVFGIKRGGNWTIYSNVETKDRTPKGQTVCDTEVLWPM